MLRCLKLEGVDDDLADSVGLYEDLSVPLALGTVSASAPGVVKTSAEFSEHGSQAEDQR